MESIKTRIVNAPQMSGIQQLSVARKVDTAAGTVNDFAVTTGTNHTIFIPQDAYVTSVHVACATALAGEGSSSTLKIGNPAGTSQVDGTSSVAADNDSLYTVDLDALAAGHTETLNWFLPPTTTHSDYTDSAEKVVPIVAEVVVDTSAATAGEIYWWVEYAFLPNKVWAQKTL